MAMKKSKKNILVFDHMKIGLVRKAYINDLNQFDLLNMWSRIT